TKKAQHVLDVRSFEEAKAPVLDEGNAASAQLELERIAMMRRAEQHCLLLERHAGLAVLEDASDHVIDLQEFVRRRDQPGSASSAARGSEVLGKALGGQADHLIGRIEDGLR